MEVGAQEAQIEPPEDPGMKPQHSQKDAAVSSKREASARSPRVLLLFSALLVTMFSVGNGNTVASLAALLVAAVATGCALLYPMALPEGDWLGRAEWVLVVSSVVAGLILTTGHLAPAFMHLTSLLWAAVTVCTILALAGALLVFRKLPHTKWAFGLFLLVYSTVTVALLRSSPAHIDVEIYLREGSVALLHGHNPYAISIPNIYPSQVADQLYGPGMVINGRVARGLPYLPLALLVAIPGHLLGDVRYSQLIAMAVTALALRVLASDRAGRVAAILGVASVSAIPMLTGAFTEPTSVALLACLVLALKRRRHLIAALFLGLLLVSKQYFVVVIPLFWLIRQWLTARLLLIGLGLAAAVTLPLFLVDPATFWKGIVGIQGVPLRPDSLSLLVSSVSTFGWPPPWAYGVLPLVGGGLTALILALRAPRTPAAFAAAVGLTLLVSILLGKQAFTNYYFMVSGALLIAAVAWPTELGPAKPSASPRAALDPSKLSKPAR
jgi:hypothetical protein